MPVHDWTRVSAGVFHDFHHGLVAALKRRLNGGLLPDGYYAFAERNVGRLVPDVLTLQAEPSGLPAPAASAGLSLATVPPKLSHREHVESSVYATLARVVTIRRVDGDRVVAVVEVVSAGNKSSRRALRKFVRKTGRLLDRRVHLLVIDLQPPTPRDPFGIHPVIWAELADTSYSPALDRRRTIAAYSAGPPPEAFVGPVGVGELLPTAPLFLTGDRYIDVPLEEVYMEAWSGVPIRWRRVIEPPADG